MSLISVKNISAGYKNGSIKENVVEDISFDIQKGELVGVLGANGCGKSTLAKAICNVIPYTGDVDVNGQLIGELSTKQRANLISYIPQSSGLSIDISVLDVVLMGFNARLNAFANPTNEMKDKAKKVIELVGLSNVINSNYLLLSEGQRRLVILARALVNEGMFLIMDEPESSLDFTIRYKFMDIVRRWINKERRAGLIILHDVMIALNCCDKLILLKDKKIAGEINLHNDTINIIEEQLGKVFGNICVTKTRGKNGSDRLIMLYESEDICEH